jgi:D-alanyl-D-alanine carboxypeptidase
MHLPNSPVRPFRGDAPARPPVGGSWSFRTVVAVICALTIGLPTVAEAAQKSKSTPKTTTPAKSGKKTSGKPAAKKAPSLLSLNKARAKEAAVRNQRIAASRRVSALNDENSNVRDNLAALTDDVKAQNAALGNAKRALSQAETELADAQATVDETTAAIDALGSSRQAAALKAYVNPQASQVGSMLNARDLTAISTSQMYLEVANRKQADDLDKLRAAEEDRRIALSKADKAKKKRAARRKAAGARLASLKASKARTEQYSADVEARLEFALGEAQSLAAIDRKLAAQIARDQAVISAQLAAAARNGVKTRDGKVLSVANFPVGTTNGIQVAASIRGKLAAMLAAAARDGIILTGGGYRSSAGQIALRRAHCGSSSYAVYQMRSSQCRPPTARPGSSQHERGLAIDFQQNGNSLTRGSSGYRWLRAHAANYGFYNLPSEAWHWSTTGR